MRLCEFAHTPRSMPALPQCLFQAGTFSDKKVIAFKLKVFPLTSDDHRLERLPTISAEYGIGGRIPSQWPPCVISRNHVGNSNGLSGERFRTFAGRLTSLPAKA
jgi:hypothetical protein